MKIHRHKLQFIASRLKLKFRKCDVRRLSKRRRCDVSSLQQALMYTWVVPKILNLNWLVFLTESYVPSSFEHYMRFLYIPLHYVFKLIGFSPKGRPKMRQFLRIFVNFK